jgi:hypothetical protein
LGQRRRRMNRQQGRDDAEAGAEIWDPIHRPFSDRRRRPARRQARYLLTLDVVNDRRRHPVSILRRTNGRPATHSEIGPA